MISIRPLDEGVQLPPESLIDLPRPAKWLCEDLKWTTSEPATPIFLDCFRSSASSPSADLFLYGVRHDLRDVLVGGCRMDGHFLEYVVVRDEGGSEWGVHRLLQQAGVPYSGDFAKRDWVSADSIPEPRSLCRRALPRWKWSAAQWPTEDGRPMIFIGQVTVPETRVTRSLFSWDIHVFLFASGDSASPRFKVVEQDANAQTAEEHDAAEDDEDWSELDRVDTP